MYFNAKEYWIIHIRCQTWEPGQRVQIQRISNPVKKSDFSHSVKSVMQKGWLYGKENCAQVFRLDSRIASRILTSSLESWSFWNKNEDREYQEKEHKDWRLGKIWYRVCNRIACLMSPLPLNQLAVGSLRVQLITCSSLFILHLI